MSDQTPNGPTDGQQWQPGAPVPPQGQPVPPKKGLPGWAWALIGVGGVLLIGIIVAVVVGASLFFNRVNPQPPCGEPGAEGCGPPATLSTTDPSTDPTTEPDSDFVSINQLADFDGTIPVWGFPVLDDWEITIFDENGINQMVHVSNGCQFTSSQNEQAPLTSGADDDYIDTQLTLESIEQDILDAAQDAEIVSSLGSTEFALDSLGSGRSIEFLTSSIEYLNLDSNTRYTNEVAVRAMPQANAAMYVLLSCPSDLVNAGDSPFEEIRAELAVIPGF